MVTVVDNTRLCRSNILNICQRMTNMDLINGYVNYLNCGIISRCIHISDYHVIHLKCIIVICHLGLSKAGNYMKMLHSCIPGNKIVECVLSLEHGHLVTSIIFESSQNLWKNLFNALFFLETFYLYIFMRYSMIIQYMYTLFNDKILFCVILLYPYNLEMHHRLL
jgi:hypothetical protein